MKIIIYNKFQLNFWLKYKICKQNQAILYMIIMTSIKTLQLLLFLSKFHTFPPVFN